MVTSGSTSSAPPSSWRRSSSAPPLFVVTSYVPTNRTCSQLAHTVGQIFRFHPEGHVLLVDNDSPPGNLRRSLAFFYANGFADRLHISARQTPSRGQLGSWLVAHELLLRADVGAHKFENRTTVQEHEMARRIHHKGHRGALLASDVALQSVGRVVLLQHSTPLKYPLPAPPAPSCRVGSLASHKNRQFYVHAREYRPDGPNAIFSAIAAALSIRCLAPCIDPASGRPVRDGTSAGFHDWSMVPHAALDFYERSSFMALGRALARPAPARELGRLWNALDRQSIGLKEVNGELERFGGLMLAWLNGYNRACERHGAKRRVFVSKVHGFTFGGSWKSAEGAPPEADRCAPLLVRPPCFDALRDGCALGHAWPPNMTRPVH
jgi:hypothetical protein